MENQKWGSSYIDELAKVISVNCPEIKGFNRRGLYRMKQFYETYKENELVSPLVTQISWTNHLLILSSTKSIEEKEFYLKLCIKEKYLLSTSQDFLQKNGFGNLIALPLQKEARVNNNSVFVDENFNAFKD